MYLYNDSILLLSLNLVILKTLASRGMLVAAAFSIFVSVPASHDRDPGSNPARSRSSSTGYTYQVNWFWILDILTAKHL